MKAIYLLLIVVLSSTFCFSQHDKPDTPLVNLLSSNLFVVQYHKNNLSKSNSILYA